jgi:hypothetical protein
VREDIGCALRISAVAVEERLHVGQRLVNRLPATLGLLGSGAITARHAKTLVDAVDLLDDAPAAKVESRVLPKAGQQTPAAFGRSVRRQVLAVDPRDADAKHRDALVDRRVCITPQPHGMAELWALLPADGAATLCTASTAAAAVRIDGDDRTMDQRRADALVALAAQRLDDPDLPKWRGRRPRVQVVVNASTLLGMDDLPADLDGYGPIPAAMARRIAADPSGTWRRLLTDPAGVLIDSSCTYRPPADLAEFVRARDRTCRFPGCPRPARRTELDHQHPWESGGFTTPDNLECLCSRHHHLKHEAGWTVIGNPNGEIIWTSPTGHTYRSPPEPYD